MYAIKSKEDPIYFKGIALVRHNTSLAHQIASLMPSSYESEEPTFTDDVSKAKTYATREDAEEDLPNTWYEDLFEVVEIVNN